MYADIETNGRKTPGHHAAAVARAIDAMRAELDAPHPLTVLARRGAFSRYHFHRVFHDVTAMTPARFLAALRMAEARRLLLHSAMPVTRISARVGYTSPGTFTTQFGRLTGITPARFRDLARSLGDEPVAARLPAVRAAAGRQAGAALRLSSPPYAESLVVGQLFPVVSPHRPGLWTLSTGIDRVRLPATPVPGEYLAYLVVVPAHVRLVDALVEAQPESYLIGNAHMSLTRDGQQGPAARLELRRPGPTDPPILGIMPMRWLIDTNVVHGRR
ncbi:MAG TPA: helix-turn-helix transcriptional regulator [Rugosimonospora sp.]|nr:helix-turn-helix transcriptional regulator [Rugosimonospora sp.]